MPKLLNVPLSDGATSGVAGKPLREVFNFTRGQQDVVVSTVEQLKRGYR